MDDESMLLSFAKWLLVFGVVTGLLMSPLLWYVSRAGEAAESQCLEAGGAWTVVGHHQQTTTMLVGKVLVPSTTTVTDYGCVSWR